MAMETKPNGCRPRKSPSFENRKEPTLSAVEGMGQPFSFYFQKRQLVDKGGPAPHAAFRLSWKNLNPMVTMISTSNQLEAQIWHELRPGFIHSQRAAV
jgi:hypothetical protein